MTQSTQSGTKKPPVHILVLEDEATHAELIRQGLLKSPDKYRVTIAQNLKEARSVLLSDPPGLIIADWLLPDGKGIEILPRKNGQVITPVVIMTSHGDEKLAVEMLKSGAIDYIVKSEFIFKNMPRIAGRALRDWENITARQKAEDALRDSEALLNATGQIARIGGWALDAETLEVTWTEETYCIHEVPPEYHPVLEEAVNFFHPDDRQRISDAIGNALQRGEGYDMELRFITARGNQLWTRSICRPIVVDHKTRRLIGVFQDITGQKKAEDAMRQANRQLSLLGAITRHDILNKVTVVLGYLDIAGGKSTDPMMIEILKKMESATRTIQSQIEFTRVYQDLGTQEPQWQELDRILPRSQVPANITLNADVQGVFVYADPICEKVFFNLLDNSVRHGEKVTDIRVSWSEPEDGLKIVWEDNGVGIAADEKERIFNRGYGKNTGLGLFLAREILAITGITITETGTSGKGARFVITVPGGMYRSPGERPKKM
jgi:signal transduction histidine kinase